MFASAIGHVAKVEEFEVANVESLRLGRDADKIACIADPAGYYWEVLERHERNITEGLCKVRPCWSNLLLPTFLSTIFSEHNVESVRSSTNSHPCRI